MKKGRPFVYLAAFAVASLILANLFGRPVFLIGTVSSLAVFVVAVRSLPPEDFEVNIERGTEEGIREVYIEDEIELKIRVKNKGDDLRFLEIHDILPPLLEVMDGSNHQMLKMEEGEELTLSYKVKCPITGEFEIGPTRLRYRDPLNFFSEELVSRETMELRVLPRTQDMDKVDINPSYTKHWLGDIKSKSIGVGSEFFSLREYQPGDEMKDINWKATARYLEPKTNEYEGEKSGDVILVVDGYEEGMIGTNENNTMKASIDAAASLASVLLSARNQVGLIVSGEYMNWIYPATGRNHYHRIMANLTKFESGGGWGFEGVKWILEEFFPRKSMIIFISPLTISGFGETIIDLSMREYDVMVISPDPLKIEKEVLEEYEKGAEKLYQIERKHLLDKLWTYGTVVVDWDPNEPLEPTLEEVLRYSQKRRT